MPSCLSIVGNIPEASSGLYWIDLDEEGPIAPVELMCDMVKGGGGWTGFTSLEVAQLLGGKMAVAEWAVEYGVDDEGRPYTLDNTGNHTHYWNFTIPFGYSEFHLSNYSALANSGPEGLSEIVPSLFQQTIWATSNNGALGPTGQSGYGDIAFGCPSDPGPTTSFGAELPDTVQCQACEIPWPGGSSIYSVATSAATAFRISWGEAGKEFEGWYPWWTGRIFFR
jgi:hypothetical protein